MTCLKFSPSDFNKRITLQTATRAPDGQGGFTETWADALTVWARIEPLKGWEKMQALQLQTPVTHKLTMRYTAAATTAKRIAWGARTMDIKEILNLNEDNAFIEMRAVETT